MPPPIQAEQKEERVIRLKDVMSRNGGNLSAAAKELGMSRKTAWIALRDAGEMTSGKPRPPAKFVRTSPRLRKQLETVLEGMVADIPEKAKQSGLVESVNAIIKLVPVLQELSAQNIAQPTVGDVGELLREEAKKKLKLLKSQEKPEDAEEEKSA